MGDALPGDHPAKVIPALPSDDDQASSADSDFVEEQRPGCRLQVVKRPSSDATDDTICSICTRQWHSSGEHRICCLKCGHLFGRSCIRKWVEMKSCCPECQRRARISDITVLFTSKFAVKDTSETQDLAIKVEQERCLRRRAESELLHLRQKYTRLQERFTQLRSTLAQSEAPFVPVDSVPLSNARVLLRAGNSLLVSCTAAGGSQFGFRRFSVLDLQSHNRFLALHQSEIRDLHSSQDGLVASASLDRHLKITSLATDTCVAAFEAPIPIWSCCFADSFLVLAGTANGHIIAYDLRRPGSTLSNLSNRTPRPISTLRFLDSHRMLCAGPGHAAIATLDETYAISSYTDFPIDERRCIGASINAESSAVLVTLRAERRPYASHVVVDVKSLTEQAVTSAHTIGLALTRAILFDHAGRRWVGSGDMESASPWLWDLSEPDRSVHLQSQAIGVVDLSYEGGIMAALSNSALNLYRACA